MAASKRDEADAIELPDSFIVAMYLPIHAGLDVEPERFFLRSLLIAPTGYNIAIGYDDGSDDPPLVAAVNIARSSHSPNTTYALPGSDDFSDTVGHICIGILDDIDLLPPGQYFFTPLGGQIEPDVVRPLIRGISSITLVNGTDRSSRLYGDIELIAGDNMRITVASVDGFDPQIIFDAIDGEGLNETCVCEDELGDCIRQINGVTPLPDGNFRLAGDECVQITPIAGGLSIGNSCSQPCCGCQELDRLNSQLDRFGDALTTLQNFSSRISAEVTNMGLVVLGSRIGDISCAQC
jgi:hypothetical protein